MSPRIITLTLPLDPTIDIDTVDANDDLFDDLELAISDREDEDADALNRELAELERLDAVLVWLDDDRGIDPFGLGLKDFSLASLDEDLGDPDLG